MTTLLDALPAQAPARTRSIPWEKAWWVPLAVILAAQAVLSVRLIPLAPLPSGDEGRYIYAGHQLIYELFHSGGSPYYETYFSGSPVIYPPLAALVDHFTGLAGVRLMSLTFMMTATVLLFTCARRLWGYWGGIASAGLFAGLGLTQDLGTYGTYDAMAVMIMAVAVYCALRTSDKPGGARWLVMLPLVLLAANATKYATVVFDPVVIGLAAFQASDKMLMAKRFLALAVTTGGLLALAVALGGAAYVHGIMFSTLARQGGLQQFLSGASLLPRRVIVSETARWIGTAIVLSAFAFALTAARRHGRHAAMLALLVFAGIIITLEALHLHSDQSMRKHDDYAAWFACLGAGAVPSALSSVARGKVTTALATAAALALAIGPGFYTAPQALSTYPPTCCTTLSDAATVLSPYLQTQQRLLLGGVNNEMLLYIDRSPSHWFSNFDDIYLKYPIPGRGGDSHGQTPGRVCLADRAGCMYLEGPAAYQAAIRAHWFALISLIGAHKTGHGHVIRQDVVIEQAAEHTRGYVLLTRAGGFPTWIYLPAYERHSHGR